jgi:zinc and cadmium transporter
MTSNVWPSTLLAVLAAGSLIFGSLIPAWSALRSRFFSSRLTLLIGFSAGLMLATALHELLPEAIESNPERGMWGAGFGFLVLYVAERLTHFHACRHRDCDLGEEDGTIEHGGECGHSHHHHAHRSTHGESHPHHHAHDGTPGHADTMALTGMTIHNFADGLTTAAAFAVSQTVGIVVVVAIVLHQMAAGLSLGAIMMRVGRTPRRIWISTAVSASFIVLGALFYNFVIPVEKHATGIVLGVAGGSFLYVAACDLLPEAHEGDEGWGITAMTLFGYIFAILITLVFGGHAHGPTH